MFSKSFIAGACVLAMGLQVSAHAIVSPALGVKGTPARSDVQRPSTKTPCGTASLAAIDTTTPVTANAAGVMTVNITNFNAGTDGSRAIKTLQIDPSGTGNSFAAAAASAITKNGIAAPTDVTSQQLTITIPAGTKCVGGKAKNLCLMSFTTDGGFGNCIAFSQAGAAANDTRAACSRKARAVRAAEINLD